MRCHLLNVKCSCCSQHKGATSIQRASLPSALLSGLLKANQAAPHGQCQGGSGAVYNWDIHKT